MRGLTVDEAVVDEAVVDEAYGQSLYEWSVYCMMIVISMPDLKSLRLSGRIGVTCYRLPNRAIC